MSGLDQRLKGQFKEHSKSALPPSFYAKKTVAVALQLLGKVLCVQTPEGAVAGRIVETEAYHGDDPASHSSRGETPRNAVMFGEPGIAYVYLIYGMYPMLNFVTERKGYPGAVLIRAVEPLLGIETMQARRGSLRSQMRSTRASPLPLQVQIEKLTNGPGKLCNALGIQMHHNGASLMGPSLFVRDDGFEPKKIRRSGRIGIRVGTEKLWRFFIDENPFVTPVWQNREAQLLSHRQITLLIDA